MDCTHTINQYQKLKTESRISQLAVKLARASVFGDEILIRCTVAGHGHLPALPLKELNLLKKTIFDLLPKYWTNAPEFEKTWKECAEAIGQCCKRLRTQLEKKTTVVIQ